MLVAQVTSKVCIHKSLRMDSKKKSLNLNNPTISSLSKKYKNCILDNDPIKKSRWNSSTKVNEKKGISKLPGFKKDSLNIKSRYCRPASATNRIHFLFLRKDRLISDKEIPKNTYFEFQVREQCGLHVVNHLVQAKFFSELLFNDIAIQLGKAHYKVKHGHFGYYSNIVLRNALRHINVLMTIDYKMNIDRFYETMSWTDGLICYKNGHWYAIRYIGGAIYIFDSNRTGPVRLKKIGTNSSNDFYGTPDMLWVVRGLPLVK